MIGKSGEHTIIKKPLITEKNTMLQGQNKYFFKVDKKANKYQVKKAVEKFFNVKVVDVNIANIAGKMKRYGKHPVISGEYKKAYVTLETGQKIEFFEGV